MVVVVGFSASLCLGSFSFFRSLVSFSILYIRLLCIYTLRVYNTRCCVVLARAFVPLPPRSGVARSRSVTMRVYVRTYVCMYVASEWEGM